MTEQVTQPENSKKRLYLDIASAFFVAIFFIALPSIAYYFPNSWLAKQGDSGVEPISIILVIDLLPAAFGGMWLVYRFTSTYNDELIRIGEKHPITTKKWFYVLLMFIVYTIIMFFNMKWE